MKALRRLLLTTAVCLLSGCEISADVASSQELIDVSDYSVHYLTGETSSDESTSLEVSFMLLSCGREGSDLIAATVEICKENGIDYTELSRGGEVGYSESYTHTVYPMDFSGGRLFVALGKRVSDGVLYRIQYE